MEKTTEEKARELTQLMEDGKGSDVTLMDLTGLNSWTDYFILVTVSSSTQWQGLYKLVKDYISENDLEIHKTKNKQEQGNEWNLIDLGNIVIHLMSEDARSFYELEKLWHGGKVLYSSKSSSSESSL